MNKNLRKRCIPNLLISCSSPSPPVAGKFNLILSLPPPLSSIIPSKKSLPAPECFSLFCCKIHVLPAAHFYHLMRHRPKLLIFPKKLTTLLPPPAYRDLPSRVGGDLQKTPPVHKSSPMTVKSPHPTTRGCNRYGNLNKQVCISNFKIVPAPSGWKF